MLRVLPSYFIYISLLYSFLVLYTYYRAKKSSVPTKDILDISLLIMVFGFLGARLTHVFYEEPFLYQLNPWRFFEFWEGGFVFYGGFILAFAAASVYVLLNKLPYAELADFFTPILALGYGLGRGACLLAGCCYGRFCEYPWGVQGFDGLTRHPTQLYVMIWELVGFATWIKLEKMAILKRGSLFQCWLVWSALGRLMMEYFRDDFRGDFIYGQSLSTWISLIILLGVILYRFRRLKMQ